MIEKPAAAFKPTTAMVLAAGLGKRMRPITSTIPKPLVEIRGKALIDYGLDALARNGVKKVVVNVHYLPDLMRAHLRKRKDMEIVISDERDELLDSGGGLVKALPELGTEPFYVINSDTFWIDGYRDNLDLLASLWDPARMDVSLLIADMRQATGYDGPGDFVMDAEGRLTRVEERDMSPFIYAGAAILKPEVFAGMKEEKFSLNRIFDNAVEADRLFGVRLGGLWITVGTPAAIPLAEAAFVASAAA
ncbi:nucleotidyltransferase family protein [Aurantimonas sp. C2-6-R+9]|uniref:nucleotidyltransferase family protein n=1 Tax=unclassified Aurantimonas TaxID=2638230 RepID=UPI002E16F840|nr:MULTISPECIES: nucleotidyltransferase family protein [unclassified Aurantimonas]MEC5289514.1 nucleotidyltransferase family protein [Aurantimonas sp. C2-3-R2]MEC5379479.1 nucleotidyltransferase family protein [Aurantimonas sp. C2-6-R+9]MEC5410595.1 nucleotidyltransferase family protein [Aurantimonas sp. C2-4-R8]